jgi:hypothetical protein
VNLIEDAFFWSENHPNMIRASEPNPPNPGQ